MTAWQPSRESVVRSQAVSRRSSSSSCASLRLAAPSRMMTWQVVHAQLPPQACSRPRSKCLDTSRNDSGFPWCEYGSLPCSNSTVFVSPSMMNVTLGIYVERSVRVQADVCGRMTPAAANVSRLHFVDVLPGQRGLHRAIHHQ